MIWRYKKMARMTKAKRKAAGRKAWRTRKRKYGRDGMKGRSKRRRR